MVFSIIPLFPKKASGERRADVGIRPLFFDGIGDKTILRFSAICMPCTLLILTKRT